MPQVKDFVCKQDDLEAYDAMWHRAYASEWRQLQVRDLRRPGLKVADKHTARELV